jgi:hypothetical protein
MIMVRMIPTIRVRAMNTKARRSTSLTGVSFAMMAAVLFGASTPFAKILLGKTEPSHPHRHERLVHSHHHYPDTHHRHAH